MEEAFKIRIIYSKDNPSLYSGYVAETLINISKLNRDDIKAEEALNILIGLVKKSPKTYRQRLALSYGNLANIISEKGNTISTM